MYKEHFGLREIPFSIAPDPGYLYLGEQHREALAHLVYGINSAGGCVLLTGEVGTGKTTVCRCLLEQLPVNTDIAFIYNPKLTVEELLATVCDELRIPYPDGTKSIKVFIDAINAYLLENFSKGRKTVIILEEAQNLSPEVLEEIRLLTNLETNRQKLLQVIMVGQPELREMLSKPELRQLSQRITARYHLEPLPETDVSSYVNYRLEVAGAKSSLFPESLMPAIYRLSKGVPRLINLICDRALLGAYVQGRDSVDNKTLYVAAKEVLGTSDIRLRNIRPLQWAAAVILFISLGVALSAAYYNQKPRTEMRELPVIAQTPKATPAVVKVGTLRWPATLPLEKSKSMAYYALLREWGSSYDKEDPSSVCEQVIGKGLRCMGGTSSFDKVVRLNRPAVIRLMDEKGEVYYAALKSVNGTLALCSIAGEDRTVDIGEIKSLWYDEYSILWQIPPAYKGILHPGDRSPVIQWLNKKLSAIQGRKPRDLQEAIYDKTLVGWVKEFQRNEGIPATGYVGPRTIIQINNKAGSNEPKLIKKGEGA